MATSALTLHQLQLAIKGAITERFPLAVWVTAEIADLKVNYSGHCYIELVEKRQGETMHSAQARAVIWRNNYTSLSAHFTQQTGQQMGAGIKVLIKVLVNFHELYGLSLQITDIDPSYTLGDAERQRQATIAQLQQDGVWDMNRTQPLPRLLQRIAIISSSAAAGYQDFCREILRSPYRFSLTLFDAVMQGSGAEESIIAALEAVAQSSEEFDCVVIIRGGGSVGDLQCFNGYRVSSHVAQFPLPIVAGIGHDKDVSVVDMVAALTLKTPTAVATMLTERSAQIEAWLEAAAQSLIDTAKIVTHERHIELEAAAVELRTRSQQLIEQHRTTLTAHHTALPERVEHFVGSQRNRLEALSENVELHSPSHLLKLGYAVARIKGMALRESREAKVGEVIEVEIIDGVISAEIKSIKSNR